MTSVMPSNMLYLGTTSLSPPKAQLGGEGLQSADYHTWLQPKSHPRLPNL